MHQTWGILQFRKTQCMILIKRGIFKWMMQITINFLYVCPQLWMKRMSFHYKVWHTFLFSEIVFENTFSVAKRSHLWYSKEILKISQFHFIKTDVNYFIYNYKEFICHIPCKIFFSYQESLLLQFAELLNFTQLKTEIKISDTLALYFRVL